MCGLRALITLENKPWDGVTTQLAISTIWLLGQVNLPAGKATFCSQLPEMQVVQCKLHVGKKVNLFELLVQR